MQFPRRKTEAKVSISLNGYCAVCITEARKWVQGKRASIGWCMTGRAYLFPSEKELNVFKKSPAKYVPALNGDCTVCYAKAGKRVSGQDSACLVL